MPVYLIQVGSEGAVKIGFAASTQRRLRALQTGNPDELRLLRTIEGGQREEKWLHKRFASQRLRGEWFRFSADMLTIDPAPRKPRPAVTSTAYRMETYLAQLDDAAEAAGATLAEACKAEGVALTTLMRWRRPQDDGGTSPSEKTAKALYRRIERMKAEQPYRRAA